MMDDQLLFSLWFYSPTSDLSSDPLNDWRDPNVAKPTQQQIDQAWAYYQSIVSSVTLSVDKATIAGDGIDAAVLTVTYYLPYPDMITVLINDQEYALDNPLPPFVPGTYSPRVGTIEITSSNSGIITVATQESYQSLPASDTLIIEVT
jgi:hypothetical protein